MWIRVSYIGQYSLYFSEKQTLKRIMSVLQSGIITQNWSSIEIIVSSCALIVVNVLAVSGNLLVIFVISHTKELRRKESNWFVVNLALADLLLALTVIPTTLDTLITTKFRLGLAYKEFIGFANFLFCICSIMNLQLLSVDRWFAIAKPFKYLDVITPRKASAACLFVWIYSMFCALPPKFGVSSYYCFIPNLDVCDLEKDWSGSYKALSFAVAVLGLTYCLPLTVMIVSYWKIFRITRLHVRRINVQRSINSCVETNGFSEQIEIVNGTTVVSNTPNTEKIDKRSVEKPRWWKKPRKRGNFSRSSDIQTAKSFLFVIGVYFLCWTPFCVTLLLEIILNKKTNPTVALICLWIGYANSCLNPIIYTWKYKQFRHALVFIGKKFRGKFCNN